MGKLLIPLNTGETSMPEFITLSCPSCGAKLQIGNEIEQFACGYCGNEHVVKRSGGIVSLAPLVEQIQGVRTGVDKTASELAIQRLKGEIEDIRRSMPATGEGCLSKLGIGISVVALFMCVGGILTGETGTIIGGIAVGLGLFIFGVWLGIKEDDKNKAKLKPYHDAIAEKQKEIDYHEKIVKAE
jgi:predicted RNA-binding Zn-ribbon protein involved in translation (DUF1610 family)